MSETIMVYRPLIRTPYNRVRSKDEKESHPDAKSQTVPDQSLSVREIVKRHAQGISTDVLTRIPIYEGEEFTPDFEHMDLADRQSLLEAAREELADIRKRANEKALKVKQAKEVDAIKAAYERLKAEGKIGVEKPSDEAKPNNPI